MTTSQRERNRRATTITSRQENKQTSGQTEQKPVFALGDMPTPSNAKAGGIYEGYKTHQKDRLHGTTIHAKHKDKNILISCVFGSGGHHPLDISFGRGKHPTLDKEGRDRRRKMERDHRILDRQANTTDCRRTGRRETKEETENRRIC